MKTFHYLISKEYYVVSEIVVLDFWQFYLTCGCANAVFCLNGYYQADARDGFPFFI